MPGSFLDRIMSLDVRGPFVVALVIAACAAGADETDVTAGATLAPLAEHSLLLDGVAVDGRLVVVGERGHILVSEDEGNSWRQVPVPTRATLTAVHFHGRDYGWAVGHDSTILRTEDGGESWTVVYSAPEDDTPFLDLWFRNADRGVAVGAYGYYYETSDGGLTWAPTVFDASPLVAEEMEADEATTAEDDPLSFLPSDEDEAIFISDLHLNHIRSADDGTLYIAAEAGNVFRSDDGGGTWTIISPPYEGSFFGVSHLDDGGLLAYGMSGMLFRSDDNGATWSELDSGVESILMDAAKLDDGRVVIVGLAGAVLVSGDGRSFELLQQEDRTGIATVLPVSDGVVLVGEAGVHKIPLN